MRRRPRRGVGVHGDLTLRAETVTRAAILRRNVPAVAQAKRVPGSAHLSVATRIEAKAENRSRSWFTAKRDAEVPSEQGIELLP